MIIRLKDKQGIDLCEIALINNLFENICDEVFELNGQFKFGVNYLNGFNEPIYLRNILSKLVENHNVLSSKSNNVEIITSFDFSIYERIKSLLLNHVKSSGNEFGFKDGMIVVIDPDTNKLKCFASTIINSGELIYESFNKKQVGSSLKPFLLYIALKNRVINISDFISDSAVNLNGFIPRNWDYKFMGNITIREALVKSRNVPFVKLLNLVGIDNFVEVLSNLHYLSYDKYHRFDLSLILGRISTNLITHTNAYSVFLNNKIKRVGYVNKIKGDLLPELTDSNEFDKSILQEVKELLKKPDPLNIYGKTGTTDGHRDNYFIGFNERGSAFGVWLGNKNSKSMSNLAFGSVTAQPLCVKLQNYLI